MRNFNIKAAKDDTTVIDIIGKEIGESWWGDSFSMMDAKAELENIKTGNIVVNISSLGGDLNDGLVIHDLLKAHKSHVTAKVMGATASSATVIAMGADSVEMSENALFLVHNASSGVWGNAEDMRKTAADLEVFDNRIVSIYEAKTNKSDSEIRSLMAEDKWISAEDAKEFGFIDSTYTPTAAAAQISFEGNNKNLPKVPENLQKKIYNQNQIKMSEINEQSIVDKVVASISALLPSNKKVENKVDEPVNNAELIKNEVAKALAEANEVNKVANDKVLADKDAELVKAQADLATANEAAAKAAAGTTDVENKVDVDDNGKTVVTSADNLLKVFIKNKNKR